MKLRPGLFSFPVQCLLDFSHISPCEMSVNSPCELRISTLPSHKLFWTKVEGKGTDSIVMFDLRAKFTGLLW